jgi:hypothetical protein
MKAPKDQAEVPSDDDYEAQARAHYARANPAGLVALGDLSRIELVGGRVIVAPRRTVLAYYPGGRRGSLVVVFGCKKSRARPPASAAKEYAAKHWGEVGAWGISSGEAPDVRGSHPRAPKIAKITYTTKKGGDSALVDYVHDFEETLPSYIKGTGRKWQIHGGSYRVTDRGIVG